MLRTTELSEYRRNAAGFKVSNAMLRSVDLLKRHASGSRLSENRHVIGFPVSDYYGQV
jgi:hypothetical protein